jgi:hypothetical protein
MTVLDLDTRATVAQVARELDAAPDAAQAMDDAIRLFRPSVAALALHESVIANQQWSAVGDDLVSVGLDEIYRFLARILAGWMPDNPDVAAFDVARVGISLKIRSWIDYHRDPFSGSGRAWQRHRCAAALEHDWRQTHGSDPRLDGEAFLAWASTRTRASLTLADLDPPAAVPAPLTTGDDWADHDSTGGQDWDSVRDTEREAQVGLEARRAARTVIAWADNVSGEASIAARALLTSYTTGWVGPFPGRQAVHDVLPGCSASDCARLHREISVRFRDELGNGLEAL